MSLSKRNLQLIIGGFFVILGLLGLLGAVALHEVDTLARQTRNLYQHPFAVSNALLQANVEILEIRQHLLEVIVSSSDEELEESAAHISEHEAKIYGYFETVEENFLGDSARLQKLFEDFADWRPIRAEIIALMQAGKREEAGQIAMEDGKGGRHFIMVTQEIQDLVEFAEAKAAEFMSGSIALHQQNRNFLIAMTLVIALALILVFLFGAFLLNAMLKKLLKSEARYRELYEKTPVLQHSVDKQGILVDVSDHWLDHFGYSREDVVGKPVSAFLSKKSGPFVEKVALPKFRKTGKVENLEIEFVNSSGEIRLISLSAMAKYAEDGSFDRSLSVLEDITERRQAEQMINRFSRLFEHSVHEIYIFDSEELHFIEVSKGAIKNLGYSMEELASMTPLDLKPEFTSEQYEALINPLRTGEREQVIFETVHRRKDRSEYPVEVRLHFSKNAGPDVFFAIISDITERRRAEQEIHKLSLVVEQSPTVIIITDPDGIIEYVNSAFTAVTGYEAAEAKGEKTSLIKSGATPVAIYEDLWRTINGGKVWSGLLRNRKKSGEYYWSETTISPIHDGDGAITHFVSTAMDVSVQMERETQFLQSQKMESVGQLTGGIAHDFNNLLGIVMGNLELLEREMADRPEILDRVQKALRGAERGASLTRKLLGFSRQGTSGRKLTNVNEFISSLHELIAKSLMPSIEVQRHLAPDLWPVLIDADDFESAILNLALNARDAMPDGGLLVIETTCKLLDEDYVKRNPQAITGEYVAISVSDTGVGMTDEVRAKAFEPFFTTKERGKGTGLGLSMVYGFVRRSGGHVKIYSEEGAGTTVRLYLPRADEKAAVIEETGNHKDDGSLPAGSETILVVDDEAGLVEVAVLHLEDLGYKTLSATDGQGALKILKDHPEIDLLFADVIMPGGLSGYELARAALKTRPSLKVLLTSGFSKKREESVNGDDAVSVILARKLLSKPYNRAELAQAIRRTLDEKNADET